MRIRIQTDPVLLAMQPAAATALLRQTLQGPRRIPRFADAMNRCTVHLTAYKIRNLKARVRVYNYYKSPTSEFVTLSRWPHQLFEKNSGVIPGLSVGTCGPNLKWIALPLTIKKFTGVTWPWPHPVFEKKLKSHVETPWEHAFTSTFKSVALTVLEQL